MLLEINSTLIWTIAGVVVAVIAVIVALLIHQSNKKTKSTMKSKICKFHATI